MTASVVEALRLVPTEVTGCTPTCPPGHRKGTISDSDALLCPFSDKLAAMQGLK